MLDLIDEAMDIMDANLKNEPEKVALEPAYRKEVEIDKARNKLRKEQVKAMEVGEFNPIIDGLYKDLYHLCEKLGDHIINVTEAITGERERELKKDKD